MGKKPENITVKKERSIGNDNSYTSSKSLKECEELLAKEREENRMLRSIMQLAPGNIFWLDSKSVTVWCNDNQLRTLQLASLDDFVGKSCMDVIPDAYGAAEIEENNKEVMRSKQELTREELGLNEEGSPATYLTRKIPLFDKTHSKVIGLLGIAIDITDSKRVEQLQKEKELAEKLIEFSNIISGSIAHETRTPLCGISMQIDLLNILLSTVQLPAEQEKNCKQVIDTIKQIIKSSVHVIADMLLKIRHFSVGKVQNDVDKFIVTSIVDDVQCFLDTYPFDAGEKSLVKLKNFCITSDQFQYVGDAALTKHVLYNLLRNALSAIKVDGGEITLELISGKQFNQLVFRDTAGSLPSDLIANIFDPYKTKKSVGGGTGLGLYFCKAVMLSYGGDIVCNAKEGKFTEFVLTFPAIC